MQLQHLLHRQKTSRRLHLHRQLKHLHPRSIDTMDHVATIIVMMLPLQDARDAERTYVSIN